MDELEIMVIKNLFHRVMEQAENNNRVVLERLTQIERKIMALQDNITALQTEVANNTSVESSAVTLIQGLATQLAAALATASAAGATPAQLQSLTDLQTTLTANDAALAAAVTANTPVTPTPTPAPGA